MIQFDEEGAPIEYAIIMAVCGLLSVASGILFLALYVKHKKLRRHPGSILLLCAVCSVGYSAYFLMRSMWFLIDGTYLAPI